MNSFLRWFTVNGIIMALFLVGVLTQSPSIYFAFTLIAISSVLSVVYLFLPAGVIHAFSSTPFWGKRFFDFLYDAVFIAALIYFGYYIWAIIYLPILVSSQLFLKDAE